MQMTNFNHPLFVQDKDPSSLASHFNCNNQGLPQLSKFFSRQPVLIEFFEAPIPIDTLFVAVFPSLIGSHAKMGVTTHLDGPVHRSNSRSSCVPRIMVSRRISSAPNARPPVTSPIVLWADIELLTGICVSAWPRSIDRSIDVASTFYPP